MTPDMQQVATAAIAGLGLLLALILALIVLGSALVRR